MLTIPGFTWLAPLAPRALGGRRERIDAVTMEVGHDDALILAGAHADRTVRLAFGTGEEFRGSYLDLPAKIGSAARNVLDLAGPLIAHLPRHETDDPSRRTAVRFVVQTSRASYAGGAAITDLNDGRSRLAPLWIGFAELVGPLIVALFNGRVSPDSARCDVPGLARARGLWR